MAVYTSVPYATLQTFLAEYDLGRLIRSTEIAEGVENTNYLVETDRERAILTLYEKRVDSGDLPWFLGLMRHLSQAGVNCPIPIVARDGEALRTLMGRPCALTTFLHGRPVDDVTPSSCVQLGKALARLHVLGAQYAPPRLNTMGVHVWASMLKSCKDTAVEEFSVLLADLAPFLSDIEAQWPQLRALPTGQIHGDLFPDNVFFADGVMTGLIDFYFACTDFLAYDIAICLNAWCFPDERNGSWELVRALLDGYQHVRKLTSEEKKALPVLAQGAAIRFTLSRLYDWLNTPETALVVSKDPRPYHDRAVFWRSHSKELTYVGAA